MDVLLLDTLWQGAPIVAIAFLMTLPIPRRHAATRYAIWFAALIALVAVPLATLWQPQPNLPASEPIEFAAGATTVAHRAAVASGMWFTLLWFAGAAFCLSRLGFSYARIRGILRRARPAPEFGANVVLSDDVALPISAGFINASIVIPSSLAATLDRSDLAAIVLHERAHIERGDIAGNLIQRLLEALLFFNPWVYLIGRALVREREAACDDRVVVATGESNRYASCLTRLAQRHAPARTPLLTPSAIGSRRMLVARVARLLNGKAVHVKINRPVVAASVVLFGALAFALQTAASFAQSDTTPAASTQVAANCDHDVRVLTAAPPKYPQSARGSGPLSANVVVTVNARGDVTAAKIVKSSGNAAVDQATLVAAQDSTYSPKVVNCKATQGSYLFHAEFNPS